MSEITTLLDQISIFGAINALLIGIFIIFRKDKTKSGFFLGILLLLLAITNIRSFLMHLSLLPQSWIFNTGYLHTTPWWMVLFFFYIAEKFEYSEHKNPKHYILPFLGTVWHFVFMGIENRETDFLLEIGRYNSIYEAITFSLYAYLTLKILRNKKGNQMVKKLTPVVSVFMLYALTYPLISILFMLQVEIFTENWAIIYIPVLFYESFSTFFVAIFSISEVKRFKVYFDSDTSKRNSLTSQNYLKEIEERQLYLDVDLTLDSLASIIGTSTRNLSESINEYTSLSFNKYINQLRIQAFKELVKNGIHKKYSILGVAKESGFKSKATFNRGIPTYSSENENKVMLSRVVDNTLSIRFFPIS